MTSMAPASLPRYRALIAAVAFALSGAAAAQQYETPTSFNAADFAPTTLLAGPLHTVDPKVTVEGGLPRFTIRSNNGTWEARGREMLAVRVSELPAFERIERVSKSDEFGTAIVKAAAAPLQATGQLIERPVETVGNVASGIGTIVGRAGRFVGSTAQRATDSVAGDTKKGPQIMKPIAEPLGTAQPRALTGDPLGYNTARRQWAHRLNVDAYTSNAPLGEKLSELARVTFAGSFPVETALGTVVAPVQYIVTANTVAQLKSYELPPNDIEKSNEGRLSKMGIQGLTVRNLFRNGYFTPTLQTALVLSLEALGEVSGRGDIVELALRAASENEARYVIGALALLSKQASAGDALASVRTAGPTIVGQTRGGKVIVAVPLEYVPWVQPVGEFAQRGDLKATDRSLVVAGRVSPRATKELAAAGWRVSANAAN